jgi:hypothetical protein
MAYGTVNADVIGTSVANSNLGAGNATRFKNRIINGDMRIDQRSAGASFTPTTSVNYGSCDRWSFDVSQNSKMTAQQNGGAVTPPVGFINYEGCTSSSAYSVASGDYFMMRQAIEGLNVADLAWGTANAKTVTLSFWVRSSLTGTFGGALRNSAGNRSYPFTYTITAANTWELETITIAGDTTGTWLTTNGIGINLDLSLGAGSTYSGTANTWAGANYVSATGATSVVGTNGATFYVTGVQLEVGSSATGFEYVDYTTQFTMCQRYYYRLKAATSYVNGGVGRAYSSTNGQAFVAMPVSMRTAPTASYSALSDWNSSGSGSITAMNPVSQYTTDYRQMSIDITSPFSSGQSIALNANNTTNAWIDWSAEL